MKQFIESFKILKKKMIIMTFFAFNSLSSLLQKLEVVCLYTRAVVNRIVNNQASVQSLDPNIPNKKKCSWKSNIAMQIGFEIDFNQSFKIILSLT